MGISGTRQSFVWRSSPETSAGNIRQEAACCERRFERRSDAFLAATAAFRFEGPAAPGAGRSFDTDRRVVLPLH
jgi:hypothetical protein